MNRNQLKEKLVNGFGQVKCGIYCWISCKTSIKIFSVLHYNAIEFYTKALKTN